MTKLQFAGCSYSNIRDLCDAIAVADLGADGANSNDSIRRFLAEQTDEQLAAECIKNWFVEPHREPAPWEEEEGFETMAFEPSDLAEAYRRLRNPEAFKTAFGDDE